jgi:DNA-binding MarR family transcriptional regulator
MADPPGFSAMNSMLRLHRTMTAVVDQELKHHFHLRLIDYEILKSLQDADGVHLLGEVARQLVVHATTASISIDRLAERGLATRRAHPNDRRATLVEITDDGRAVADGATAALDRVGFGLPDESVRALAEIIARIHEGRAEPIAPG